MARSRQTSSGKAVVTGASLVLGQLGKTASQLSTLRARESTLAEKGRYRAAAVIAGEAPVGAVDVSAMPRRECFPAGAAGTALHEAAHAQWREECMGKKLRQRRTAAAYEKRVGLFNDWARHAGYDSFCEWEQQAPGRYELKLIIEDGAPRVPTVASLLEFGFLQAAGEIAKGGRREYRNEPQYRKVHGRTQGEALMPEAKRHAYGYGPYADEAMRFTSIEQYFTAIRQWLTEKLKGYPMIANPALNGYVRDCTKMLARSMGRSRVESHLPATMSVEFVKEVASRADPQSIEEMQMVLYLVKNLIHGTRAHDENLLDWSDVTDQTQVGTGHCGMSIKYISTKNNKEQEDRKKGLSCVEGCQGKLVLTEDGKIDPEVICPAHLLLHLKQLVASKMGVAMDDLEGPVFGKYAKIGDVPVGATLRESASASVADKEAHALVCVVTAEEDAAGMRYDRSMPFVVHGKQYWPPMRGMWVEVAGKGYAVRACSSAVEMTQRLRAQLHKANASGETDLLSPAEIKKISTKSLRRSMATILARSPEVTEEELVAMGEWADGPTARLYVERADVFARARNHSQLLFGSGRGDGGGGGASSSDGSGSGGSGGGGSSAEVGSGGGEAAAHGPVCHANPVAVALVGELSAEDNSRRVATAMARAHGEPVCEAVDVQAVLAGETVRKKVTETRRPRLLRAVGLVAAAWTGGEFLRGQVLDRRGSSTVLVKNSRKISTRVTSAGWHLARVR